MFRRPDKGLLDFCVAALLLWAAAYHTPVGAAALHLAGWLTGRHTSARPLLAYYSDGVYDAQETPLVLPPVIVPTLDPGEALGQGVYAAWSQLPDGRRGQGRALARRYDVDPARLDGLETGPRELALLIERAGRELGSPDAAVLALFLGYEPAQFAAQRSRTEGLAPTLDELVRQLPPGYTEGVGAATRALMLGTAYSLAWPVAESAPMTSPFGYRQHPILGVRKLHTGVDLAVPVGTTVRAVGAATVRRASEDAVNGKVLVLDHGHGVSTAYCHNSALLAVVGQTVAAGERVALSGSTGRSTGPHLHYQLQLRDEPVDPLLFRARKTQLQPRLTVGGDD